jgi:hypothetical protein
MGAVSEQQETPARPPQVTVACLIVMFGSVFVVLLMWDRIAGLHTLQTRETVQTFLDRPGLQDAGLTLTGLLTTVKVVSMFAAGCATAMVILGWQATQRSHAARLALSILAVPLFVSGLVSDGFVSSGAAVFWCSGVAAAVATLWFGPNRAWFAEAPGATAPSVTSPAARPRPAVRTPAPPSQAWPPPPPTQQGPQHEPQQDPRSPEPQAPWPAAWPPPPSSTYDATRRGRVSGARPRALVWACVITWVGTGIAAAGLLVSLVALAGDSQRMIDEMVRQNPQLTDQGLTDRTLLAAMWVMTGVGLAATVAAATFAVLLFLRHRWAWYALVASAVVAAGVFLLGTLGSPVGIVFLGAAVATIGCLARPEVRTWLQGRPSS